MKILCIFSEISNPYAGFSLDLSLSITRPIPLPPNHRLPPPPPPSSPSSTLTPQYHTLCDYACLWYIIGPTGCLRNLTPSTAGVIVFLSRKEMKGEKNVGC